MRLSDLTDIQKSHLIWQLDHKTAMGLLTACRLVKGEAGNLEVVKLVKMGGRTDCSAKIHATKVRNYAS